MKAIATDRTIEPEMAITDIKFNGRTLVVCSDLESNHYTHVVMEMVDDFRRAIVLQDYTTTIETSDYTIAKHFHDSSVASVVDDLEKGKL